jgi:hypothetical protein
MLFLERGELIAGQPSAGNSRLQVGNDDDLVRFKIFAVSAMKCTPAKQITSAFVF